MSEDFWGLNLNFDDFDKILKKESLAEEPVSIQTFVTDKKYLGLSMGLSEKQLEIARRITQIYKPETLIQLMGEEKGLEYYKNYNVNEVICMLGKGCKTGNSKIWIPNLGYIQLKDLTTSGNYVDSLYGLGISSAVNKMGNGKCVRVTTKRGYSSDVYIKHKFLAAKANGRSKSIILRNNDFEWIETDKLECGDFLPIQTGWIEPTNPIDIDPDLCRLIGYMLGDGSFSEDGKSHPAILTNVTKEVIEDFINIVEKYGHHVKEGVSGYGASNWKILSPDGKNNFFTRLFKEYGLLRITGQEKPWCDKFMNWSDQNLGELLRGIYATDGWIYVSQNTSSCQIGIDITSQAIAKGLQMALLRLGIVSTFKEKENSETETHSRVWRCWVTSWSDCQKLLRIIGNIPGKESKCQLVLNTDVKEKHLKNAHMKSPFYLDEIVSITDIGDHDYYDINVWPHNSYLSDGFCNHNSGKDHTSRISFAYIAYLLHCLRDPLEYFGKSHGVTIDLLNLAVNAQQAQRVFFEPLKKLLLSSPYFNEVGFEPRVGEVFFFSRPIRFFSGHSESEGWEGYELLITVLDEIAAFKTDIELKGEMRAKGSASAIYEMSHNSVTSRFPEVGKVVLLSFPRYRGDFITQRYDDYLKKKSDGKDKYVWGLKAATYEVNPTITREQLEPAFQRNPVEARARFECEPPEMEDPYFREPELVRRCFNYGDSPVLEDGTWAPWFNGTDQFQRFIHIDLGLKRDKSALCMVHLSGMKDVETMAGVEKLPIINMDYMQTWKADHGKEINFADIRNTIQLLSKKFPIAMITFDMWSSADMIQTLRSWGFNAEWHTVRKTDYDTLQTAIYDGRIRGYWNEQLVEKELLQLKLINNSKVDHPSTGEKDAADALAGAVYMCVTNMEMASEMEIELYFDEYDREAPIEKIRPTVAESKPAPDMPDNLKQWLVEML